MKKSDLKNGMVVELRNGKRFFFFFFIFFVNDSCINLVWFMGYDKNLYDFSGYSEFDVTKIYKTVGNIFKTLFDNERLNLIWEREEKSKLSKEDKKIIKNGLKKVQTVCKEHKDCFGCPLLVGNDCPLDNTEEFDLDKLFED